MVQKVETLIVGAGVIGSSVAMHLAKMGMAGIRVIDFDLEGSLSSSELNAGGVRATWVHPINISMSRASIEFFSTVAEEVGYKACGYLWLHPAERIEAALKAREKQIELGWPVEVWDLPQLKRRVPFLDKTEGIAGSIYAPRDGLINPNLLKNFYRNEARVLGVQFDDRTLLREVSYAEVGSALVHATAERFPAALSADGKLALASAKPGEQFGRELEMVKVEYHAQRIINCAGPWAASVAQMMGYRSPSYSVRRQVSIFDCREVDLTPYGMIVDTSGVYFHPEATNGLAGFANTNEPRGVNYHYDGEGFFNEMIWPALYERSTSFEKLKHLTGWAGLYEVSPDESAILGVVEPMGTDVARSAKMANTIFEAHSFSGHGVMHSYSAGLALAEKIIKNRYETFDAEILSGTRFNSGQLIEERLII
jgi:glycine/D-amino acid oxidase-like deaminating enzyme